MSPVAELACGEQRGVHAVVIDSGVDLNHREINGRLISGMSVNDDGGEFRVCNDYRDEIGHGTAVVALLQKISPRTRITVIKVFEKNLEITKDKLCYTLAHVLNHIPCDIINLSLGVREYSRPLLEITQALAQRATIVIAGFDNDGAISFPAGYSHVLGVDSMTEHRGKHDFIFVEGDDVLNVRAYGGPQRIARASGAMTIAAGSSYATARVSGYVANILEEHPSVRSFSNVKAILREHAIRFEPVKSYTGYTVNVPFQRAVTFPLNKEMHSVIRFSDMLQFQLAGILDVRQLGRVGQYVSKVIGPVPRDMLIFDVDRMQWDTFDGVVLGHYRALSQVLHEDVGRKILADSIKNKRHVYSFSDLSEYDDLLEMADRKGVQITFPVIARDHVPPIRRGKLRQISTPVLGVFGTNSFQGKFTLQLTLRRMLLSLGYRVGQLGTEPSAALFGFEVTYPMGYEGTVKIHSYDAILMLNAMMANIEEGEPDIIIVGSQSGTIPYDTSNLSMFPMGQLEFLLGTSPDAYLLVVDLDDQEDYVRQTIAVLENLGSGRVIGIVVFPWQKVNAILGGKRLVPIEKDMVQQFKDTGRTKFDRPIYDPLLEADKIALVNDILSFFS